MKPIRNIFAAVAAGTFVFGAAMTAPLAQTPAVTQDKAQLKADESALAREKAQLKTDQKTSKDDTKSGKSAAESKDSAKIYNDKQAVKGATGAVAADRAKLKTDEKK